MSTAMAAALVGLAALAWGGGAVMRSAAGAGEASPPATNPFHGEASLVPVGRSLFNQYCSHCHAPNAVNPEPTKDLRRLRRRYGDRMTDVFYTTITGGRPTLGMPPWGGVLSEERIWTIFTFLESVQSGPE